MISITQLSIVSKMIIMCNIQHVRVNFGVLPLCASRDVCWMASPPFILHVQANYPKKKKKLISTYHLSVN